MPRTVTVSQIRTQVRRHADMENSTFVSDAEMIDYISANYAALYDQLVNADPERYLKEQTFTGDGATKDFAVDSDYYGTIHIMYNTDGGGKLPLRRIYGTEIAKYHPTETGISVGWHPVYNTATPTTQKLRLLPTPESGATYTHSYVVAPADLTTASDSIDGVSGWEKYIVLLTVLDCRDKEETPTGSVERQIAKFEQRLAIMRHNRDAANAGRIVDTRGDDREGFINDIARWYYY